MEATKAFFVRAFGWNFTGHDPDDTAFDHSGGCQN